MSNPRSQAPMFAHLAESFTPPPKTHGLTHRQRRAKRKQALLESTPRCHACGCKLTNEPNRSNTATLIRQFLSCEAHRDLVGRAARQGENRAIVTLQRKRPASSPLEYHVDGEKFTTRYQAVLRAIELANCLGSEIDVCVIAGEGTAPKRIEVVRPVDRSTKGGVRCSR